MIRFNPHPQGRRCYVLGRRVHHGLALVMAAFVARAIGQHPLATALSIAVVHDAQDFPWRDTDNH